MNFSSKGSSFKNTYGYLNFLLNLSSICFMLFVIPFKSLFLASITIAAFARRSWMAVVLSCQKYSLGVMRSELGADC